MNKSGLTFWSGLFAGFMVLMLLYIVFMIVAPVSAKVHLRWNAWQYDHATFLLEQSPSRMVLQASSRPGFRAPTISVLHVIDLVEGQITRNRYEKGKIRVNGIQDDYIWIRKKAAQLQGYPLNDFDHVIDTKVSLKAYPDLAKIVESIELEGKSRYLRIIGLDGHQYQWHPDKGEPTQLDLPPPPIEPTHLIKGMSTSFRGSSHPPQQFGDQLLLEAEFLWDAKLQALMELEDGERMLHYRDLKGPKGQLFLARISGENQPLWQLNLTEVSDHKKIKSPALVLSTREGALLYLLVEDYEENAHLQLFCIDLISGEKIWDLKI